MNRGRRKDRIAVANGKPPSKRIDWQAIKQQLAESRAALAASEELSLDRAKVVMDERARLLAFAPPPPPDTNNILEVLTLRLGRETFGIETGFICEVQRPGDITPLPGSPSFLLGVTNLRGAVLAVMDLREMFGIPVAGTGDPRQVVIGRNGNPEFGILADDVYEVVAIRLDEVVAPPDTVTGRARDCLRGVTKDAMLVIHGDALLTEKSLYVDQENVR